MRRWAVLAVVASLLWAGACSRKQKPDATKGESSDAFEEQGSASLSPIVHVADPKTAGQLLSGWYAVEQGSWRWTAKQFVVDLRTPGPDKPAQLQLKFTLPDVLISRLGSITLAATVNGVPLPAETFGKAGDQVYSRALPGAINGNVARVVFQVDKTLPPNDIDRRELGVVVSSVGLE
ncbi:MAG: hypothetical protein HY236_07705 [Acidobacteria bacterium]|nr:hypothetical protein [Acidobacteriota bacterium]